MKVNAATCLPLYLLLLLFSFQLTAQTTCKDCSIIQKELANRLRNREYNEFEKALWRYSKENLNYQFAAHIREKILGIPFNYKEYYTPFSFLALVSRYVSDSTLKNVIERTDFNLAKNLQVLHQLAFDEKVAYELKRISGFLPEKANKYLFIFCLNEGNGILIDYYLSQDYPCKKYDLPGFKRGYFSRREKYPIEPSEAFVMLNGVYADKKSGHEFLKYYFAHLPEVDFSKPANTFHYIIKYFSSRKIPFPISLPENDTSGRESFFELYKYYNPTQAKITLFQNTVFTEDMTCSKKYFAQGYRNIFEYKVNGTRLDTIIHLQFGVSYIQTNGDTLYASTASRACRKESHMVLKTNQVASEEFRALYSYGSLLLLCFDTLRLVKDDCGFEIRQSIPVPRGLYVVLSNPRVFLAFENNKTTLYSNETARDTIAEDLSKVDWKGDSGLLKRGAYKYSYYHIGNYYISRFDIEGKARFLNSWLLEFQDEKTQKKGALNVKDREYKVILSPEYDEIETLELNNTVFLKTTRKGKTKVFSGDGKLIRKKL